MKPKNWDSLSKQEKLGIARELFPSVRGQLIISQALVIASKELRGKKYPETSNAEDMDILIETLFPIYQVISKDISNLSKDKDTGRYEPKPIKRFNP